MDKINRKQTELQELNDAEEPWFRKLMRAANAIDVIRKRRKRLIKPDLNNLPSEAKIDSKDWHKIREQEFSDEIPDFLRRI